MPDQMTTMGVHAMAGIGSSTERSGTKNDSQKAKRPIKMPTMVPTTAAMKNENGRRHAVFSVCSRYRALQEFPEITHELEVRVLGQEHGTRGPSPTPRPGRRIASTVGKSLPWLPWACMAATCQMARMTMNG